MAIVKDNSKAFLKLVQQKLANGLRDAMEGEMKALQNKTTAQQVPPRSEPGQYPARETGQLEQNITFGVDGKSLEGRVGVMGEGTTVPNLHGQKENIGGLALWWLELHPPGVVEPRLGMLHSWSEDQEQIKADFKAGALK